MEGVQCVIPGICAISGLSWRIRAAKPRPQKVNRFTSALDHSVHGKPSPVIVLDDGEAEVFGYRRCGSFSQGDGQGHCSFGMSVGVNGVLRYIANRVVHKSDRYCLMFSSGTKLGV